MSKIVPSGNYGVKTRRPAPKDMAASKRGQMRSYDADPGMFHHFCACTFEMACQTNCAKVDGSATSILTPSEVCCLFRYEAC